MPPSSQPPNPTDLGGRRVLVIEDNTDSADTLREILEMEGHVVEVAYSGADGLAKARTFVPQVVVCDLGLPDMDGREVARSLRAEPGLRDAMLIALSGFTRPVDVEQATAAGFDKHLAKPPDLEVLERLLRA